MTHSTFGRAILLGATLATAAALPAAAQVASNGDIILHAQRASVIAGAWELVSDSTAADGLRLANPDAGQAKLATALGSPSDYFELKFTPEVGRAYHLWIRSKAENDAWTNDSVFVQFSGSQNASGGAAYRIGTSSAIMYSLEEASGAGESGWGWQDNGYGYNVLGDALYFNGTSQTIRVQAREDGISIDQIVLSPVAYAITAPGAAKDDTTIVPEPGSSPPPPITTTGGSITWSSVVKATVSGTTLKKTSGCGDCSDAGGVSQQQISSGSVSFSVAAGYSLAVGLGRDASTNTGAFNYAFSFDGSSTFEIREGGVYRSEGPFSASDVFMLGVEGTVVKYYRNGTLVYTSKVAVPGPMVVDTTLVSMGASVNVKDISGSTTTSPTPTPTPTPTPAPDPGSTTFTWKALVNATASGSQLKKTSGCGTCNDAGGVSSQQLTSGSVSFTVPSGHTVVAGLGRDASSNTSYAIDYAFSFSGTSAWEVREGGVYKTEGPYSASDVFKVSIEGTAVKYYRNGGLVYTSKTPVSGALVVDATLVSSGASVLVTALSGSTTTAPAPVPEPAPAPSPAPTTSTLRVLQWNLHHGGFGTDGVYDTNRVADWMVTMNPDVVMLNEIEKYTGWGNEDQPEVYKALLQQRTGKTWYYVAAQEFGDWNANGKANMILSRFPIAYKDRYELVNNYDRSAALAQVTVNGRNITLISTHLDPYDASLRLVQAKEMTGWAAPQPENRIITGDMNAWPDQTSIQHFNTLYYDSWSVASSNGTATAFSGNYGETKNGRIDYIFYSKSSTNLVVQSSRVYDTRDSNGDMPSDHRPVLTVFQVK